MTVIILIAAAALLAIILSYAAVKIVREFILP